MSVADAGGLAALRSAVERRLGLQIDEGRLELLARVASERVRATGVGSLSAYAAGLAAGVHQEELRALAEQLTIGETYFFRNANDLRAFVGVVLPERIRARAAERRLRILSAGCSSGEEPYTLSMLVNEMPALAGWDVHIRGFDVNRAAITRAREARYTQWSLRQTSDELRARFFSGGPRELRVIDEVRARVEIEERNLVDEDPRFWAKGAFDIVFCRNVLMYFAPEVTRRVVSRIAASLAPGGFLFLGHAETLRGVSTDFHLRHTHDTFYYQLREGSLPALIGDPASPAARLGFSDPVTPAAVDVDWMQVIGETSERIAQLTGGSPAARSSASTPALARDPTAPQPRLAPRSSPGVNVSSVLQLVKQERFPEALAALGLVADEGERDRDALLLRAIVLASSGDPAAAEEVCARVLAVDELNAEAHYVKALCREHARDAAAAVNHDHYALYLDPSFAMPHLHLGLMAKRAGDVEAERRELARALALFAGEDGSRILLLGGGFGREALLELCRAELRAAGGLP